MLMKAPLSESFHLVEAAANFWAAGTFRKPCHFSLLSIALIFRLLLLHTATIWSNPCWHCCMLNAHNGNTHLRLLERKWKSSHAHASLLSECHTVLIKSRLFSINRLFILGKEEGTCESFQESLSLALSCCLCLWKLLKHTFADLLNFYVNKSFFSIFRNFLAIVIRFWDDGWLFRRCAPFFWF